MSKKEETGAEAGYMAVKVTTLNRLESCLEQTRCYLRQVEWLIDALKFDSEILRTSYPIPGWFTGPPIFPQTTSKEQAEEAGKALKVHRANVLRFRKNIQTNAIK